MAVRQPPPCTPRAGKWSVRSRLSAGGGQRTACRWRTADNSTRVSRDVHRRRRGLRLLRIPEAGTNSAASCSPAAADFTRFEAARGHDGAPLAGTRPLRSRAGTQNEHFLDLDLFTRAFVDALAPHRRHVAVMMFEIGTFAKSDFLTAADFLVRLDRFLGSLPAVGPTPWRFATHDYLGPDYFRVLARHGRPTSSTPGRGCRPSRSRSRCLRHSRQTAPWFGRC